MRALARFFVVNHKFTLVLSLGLILFGAFGLVRISSEAFPSVDIGSVIITTPYRGATAGDIETKITKPLEDEIRTVRGIKKVVSTSQSYFSWADTPRTNWAPAFGFGSAAPRSAREIPQRRRFARDGFPNLFHKYCS